MRPLGDDALSVTQRYPSNAGYLNPPPPNIGLAPSSMSPTNPGVLYPPPPGSGGMSSVSPTTVITPGGGITVLTPGLPGGIAPAPARSGMGTLAVLGAIAAAAALAFS